MRISDWSSDVCSSDLLTLVKMNDATATSALEGFSAALNSMPLEMRKSMTYDQGREMARHAEITQRTGVAIYFCDPHSRSAERRVGKEGVSTFGSRGWPYHKRKKNNKYI